MREKDTVLGEEEEKTNLRGRKSIERRDVKIDLI